MAGKAGLRPAGCPCPPTPGLVSALHRVHTHLCPPFPDRKDAFAQVQKGLVEVLKQLGKVVPGSLRSCRLDQMRCPQLQPLMSVSLLTCPLGAPLSPQAASPGPPRRGLHPTLISQGRSRASGTCGGPASEDRGYQGPGGCRCFVGGLCAALRPARSWDLLSSGVQQGWVELHLPPGVPTHPSVLSRSQGAWRSQLLGGPLFLGPR